MNDTVQIERASANGHRPPPPAAGAGGGGGRAGGPLPTRERRPALVALALVLVVGLAAAGAYLYSQAGRKVPVVEVVTAVPAGHPISRADLSTVDVAGAVTAIGAAHLESVVGQTAAVPLLPHTLLQRSMLTSGPELGTGQVRVGVEAKPGQIPAGGLAPGDKVEVLALPDKNNPPAAASTTGSPGNTATTLVSSAAVFNTAPDPSQTGGTLLTLIVPAAAAPSVAAASNAGLIALVALS